MVKLLIAAIVILFAGCSKAEVSVPRTPVQNILLEMGYVQANCRNKGYEVHVYSGTPKASYRYLCRSTLTLPGCSIWITLVSFNTNYLPDDNDIDDQCVPTYRP